MYNPVSTYRIQFNKHFNFTDFEILIPYLHKLGVKTIYASPIFEAVPGSNHGYDAVNPLRINPEIGTEKQFLAIRKKLDEYDMGWLQDIVPNHMAFHPGNKWLMDVLKNGQSSQYARYFDIDWSEKLMAPFLGKPLADVLAGDELGLINKEGEWFFDYYGTSSPLSPESSQQAHAQPDRNKMQELVEAQYYRLCHWQETDRHINFRRFFTINGLICLNIQYKDVFDDFHRTINQYSQQKLFNGLRVDHVDGLHDPSMYLVDLRLAAGDESYIVVEKILEPGESLPMHWPVQGNTGYDFLSLVNNLFTNKAAEEIFTKTYNELVGGDISIHEQILEKKANILFSYMGGELNNLCKLFTDGELADEDELKHIKPGELKATVAEFLIQCPVYRFYGNRMPLESNEQAALVEILGRIRQEKPDLAAAVELLRDVFIIKPARGSVDYNVRALRFYQRCMQFTGPLMAKGVEDTLMYTYNRFVGHNDVGDSPVSFGLSIEAFHQAMIERQQKWSLTLNATTTHDTKRGEDVRACLNVLTDIADDWINIVARWKSLNAELRTSGIPDANDEYFIYQTLVGVYRLNEDDDSSFLHRIEEYITKALREAKRHSNWNEPGIEYERSTKYFIAQLLDKSRPFWKSFRDLLDKIKDHAVINSLSQLVLKITCPGVPDIYQGTELWDFSMVDPDNRRAVDYTKRENWLDSYDTEEIDELLRAYNESADGRIKLLLTHLLLQMRNNNAKVFEKGLYIPLNTGGIYKTNVIAFVRRYRNSWILVATPLHTAMLPVAENGGLDWADTYIEMPAGAPSCWTNVVTGAKGKMNNLKANDLFSGLPFAILQAEELTTERSAGVLMAISSLPSKYGVGDFGETAYRFADFLSRAKQKFWQLLPINPTDSTSGHSPYSSISSMAGNTILLAPEFLEGMGLLDAKELQQHWIPESDRADYSTAMSVKTELFEKAYLNYQHHGSRSFRQQWERFKEYEAYWLEDFALFVALKHRFNNEPWYRWPDEYKFRDQAVLKQLVADCADETEKIKWLQWIFALQWKKLKNYCNALGIKLFGDIPFYISYDSADVWANPGIFCLDDTRNMTGVAGVPPDYFSEDGQLWGMPTFNWNELKKRNYKWWIDRLRKNLEHFDLVRLDHFRAFAEYWEVPAGEQTAKNGEWREGPGRHFFEVVRKELGELPFVAEDLGDKMESVYALRDEIGFPGMRVLQFAFSENLHSSVDIPHNYMPNSIAYSGTHDNNTTVGWYQDETAREDHKRLEQYTGMTVSDVNVHHVLARMVYASVAKTAILPMQDILGLGKEARMNTPGKAEGNWLWRIKSTQLTSDIEQRLRSWVELYNR